MVSYLAEFAERSEDPRVRLVGAYGALELAQVLPREAPTIIGPREVLPADIGTLMHGVIGSAAVPVAGKEWVDALHAWADAIWEAS